MNTTVIDNRSALKESLFMITINTNRQPTSVYQRQMMESIILQTVSRFKDNAVREHVIKFLNGDDIWSADIEREEIKVGFEVGSLLNRFHAHIVWDFVHYSKMQLDVHVLKQLFLQGFRDEFGWRNIHLDVRAVSNVKRNLEEYAKKQDSTGQWKIYHPYSKAKQANQGSGLRYRGRRPVQRGVLAPLLRADEPPSITEDEYDSDDESVTEVEKT